MIPVESKCNSGKSLLLPVSEQLVSHLSCGLVTFFLTWCLAALHAAASGLPWRAAGLRHCRV